MRFYKPNYVVYNPSSFVLKELSFGYYYYYYLQLAVSNMTEEQIKSIFKKLRVIMSF